MEELVFHIEKVLTLLKTELSNEIEACVRKAIDEKLKSINNDTSEDRFLTTPELEKLLSLSRSSIEALKRNGLPFFKIGDNVRYSKTKVLAYMNQYQNEKGGGLNK